MIQTKIVTGTIEQITGAESLETAINAAVVSLEAYGHRVRDVSIPHHLAFKNACGSPRPGIGIALLCYDDSAHYEQHPVDIEDLYHRGGTPVDVFKDLSDSLENL